MTVFHFLLHCFVWCQKGIQGVVGQVIAVFIVTNIRNPSRAFSLNNLTQLLLSHRIKRFQVFNVI